jgi:hypothetical protein
MDEQADPVSHATQKCLEYAARFDSPALAACDFIAVLKVGGAMTEDEIADVGNRVITELGNRVVRAMDCWPGKQARSAPLTCFHHFQARMPELPDVLPKGINAGQEPPYPVV